MTRTFVLIFALALAACETPPDYSARGDAIDTYCQQASAADCSAARRAFISELEAAVVASGPAYAPYYGSYQPWPERQRCYGHQWNPGDPIAIRCR